MSVEIYGLTYHSPLIIRTLVPFLEYNPIYLEAKWSNSEMQKYVKLTLDQSANKIPLILAGNLTILQQFFKAFPETICKVILFDYPNFLNPYIHPLLEWLDCDHQSGGAWQIAKVKYELFDEMLKLLAPISEEGKNLVMNMVRFTTRDRVNEIENVDKIPANYKELVDTDDEAYKEETVKDSSWKKKTLAQLIKELFVGVSKTKRQMMLDAIFNYFFKNIVKKEYNSKITKLTDGNEVLKKKVVFIRKWIDDNNLGGILFTAHLDYLTNFEKRCWATILEENENVSDEDLLLVLGRQSSNNEDLCTRYAEEIISVSSRPANMFAPDLQFLWSDGSFNYHPEPPNLTLMFDL